MYSRLKYAEKLRNKLETQMFLFNHKLEQNEKNDDDIDFQKYESVKMSMSSIPVHSERQSDNDISATISNTNNDKANNYFPSSVIDDDSIQRVDLNEKPAKDNENVSTVETKYSFVTCEELEQSIGNEYE